MIIYSSKYLPELLSVIVVYFLNVFLFTYYGHHYSQVCYQINSADPAITKIYWESGKGFNEQESEGIRLGQIQSTENVCLSLSSQKPLRALRIDPVDRKTEFQIRNIVIRNNYNLTSYNMMDSHELKISDSKSTHDVSIKNGVTFSNSNDPYYVWSLEDTRASRFHWLNNGIVAIATITIFIILVIIVNRKYRSRIGLSATSIVLLLYPIYWLFVRIISQSDYPGTYAKEVFWITIVLSILPIAFRKIQSDSKAGVALLTIVVVCISIAYDISTHFGKDRGRVLSVVWNGGYHWRIPARPLDNLRHSSLPYSEDIKVIKRITEPGSLILSDLATSYYLAAETDLYVANVHQHHHQSASMAKKAVTLICEYGANKPQAYIRFITAKKNIESTMGRDLKYLVINKDSGNVNVIRNCLARKNVINKLQNSLNLSQLYNGDYLELYAL